MHFKARILAIAIFLLIVAGMFTYASLRSKEIKDDLPIEDTVTVDPYSYVTRVDAMHFYTDGAHTYVGELQMPTPCDLLTSELVVDGEAAVLKFDVINTSSDCEKISTTARFMASVEASANIIFTAEFRGRPITLNSIEAPESATLETFELYIK